MGAFRGGRLFAKMSFQAEAHSRGDLFRVGAYSIIFGICMRNSIHLGIYLFCWR